MYMYTYKCAYMYICIYIDMHFYIRICIHIDIDLNKYIYIYMIYIYTYIHIQIYIYTHVYVCSLSLFRPLSRSAVCSQYWFRREVASKPSSSIIKFSNAFVIFACATSTASAFSIFIGLFLSAPYSYRALL